MAKLLSTLLLALALAASACGDDDGASTPITTSPTTAAVADDPGPNTTIFDPGPKDTTGGPETIQGTVAFDVAVPCIVLETDAERLDLAFTGYHLEELADGPALVDDDSFALARGGDAMIVAGHRTESSTACGAGFDVESLVNVTPAA